MDRLLWATDADNTLWDTDAVFRKAQTVLLSRVEADSDRTYLGSDALGFVRRLDQSLAMRHPDHLRYPISMLLDALRRVLEGESEPIAVNCALETTTAPPRAKRHLEEYYATLSERPPLRPGVQQALPILHSNVSHVIVVTEGSERQIRRNLSAWNLDQYIDQVVSEKKSVALFRHLRAEIRSNNAVMVGDQVDRDLLPASAAGYQCIWFPGGFSPSWSNQDVHWTSISSYEQAISLIAPNSNLHNCVRNHPVGKANG